MKTLREQIEELEEQARQQDREQREAQSKAYSAMTSDPANWEWCSTRVSNDSWGKPDPEGAFCRVSKRIKPEALAKWKEGGHSTFASDYQDGQWHGIVYHRTEENILTHGGGGHLVLKDPMLCNDQEWEQICSGNIPTKYLR
jgi:hypothetical protein